MNDRYKRAAETRRKTMSQIDPSTGKTLRQLNAEAVAAARKKNGSYETGAAKMVATKRADIVDGKDQYQRTAEKTAITRYGVYAGLEGKSEFEIYRYHVVRTTNAQPLHQLENFEKRAGYGKSDDPYQVDHRFSVVQGFLNNIPPYIIGHIANLQMLPSRENNSKGSSCSITKDELFRLVLGETA